MSSEIIGFVFFFGFFILLLGAILLIAYLAARSRKAKQNRLLKELSGNVEFEAFVRYNSGRQQNKFLKIKAFEGSGLIYLSGEKVYFKSTKGFQHQFDLRESKVQWEGENLVNGLLKWFSIDDGTEKLYLNVETGMFIFHTGGNKPTTRSIYEQLALRKASLK